MRFFWEQRGGHVKLSMVPEAAPEWIDHVDSIKLRMRDIAANIQDLIKKHEEQMRRTDFDDDNNDDEHAIDILTKNISSGFFECQRDIKMIAERAKQTGHPDEIKMSRNVVSALALELQKMSTDFRKSQNQYLQRLRARDKGILFQPGEVPQDTLADEEYHVDSGFTAEQLQATQAAIEFSHQREAEIELLVQSISELAQIFKDLSEMIYDQGTILDRIDHNLDVTLQCIDEAEKQLIDANKYHKKATKKIIILCLVVIVLALVIAVASTK
ncbi:hypothetical protein, variant [Capsaspora owczarzaki ATCC 30864]|uniref:t-SNARE coiled-coil homology domain-containing protein n=1 Tax=Capsaspora owczarzaki (strain ATCC 30864) TaxID=595528 RepID=A0A0D2VKN5_CAPO3|nr:hypothetical protein, variant [Capsaspora owczarzaki ATCC 30864]